MVRRGLALIFSVFAWLLASVVVVGALAFWRLSVGPVPLTFIKPYMEEALTPADGALEVRLAETQLRLVPERGLQIVALDVKGLGANGEVLIALPEVEVGLDAMALLRHGLLAPDQLVVRAPELILERRADGSIGLRGRPEAAGAPALGLVALSDPLLNEEDPASPLSFLDAIRIGGARVRLQDQESGAVLDATEGVLTLARERGGVAARIDLDLDRPAHALSLTVLIHFERPSGQIRFEASADGLRAADLRALAPFLPQHLAATVGAVPARGIEPAFRIEARGSAGLDGRWAPVRFLVESDGGEVILPDVLARPLRLNTLRVRGVAGLAGDTVGIEELVLEANDARIEGAGRIRMTPEGPAVTGSLQVSNLAAAQLDALWPLPAADEARAWVTEHITHGRVPEGAIEIDLRPGDLDQRPLRHGALEGRFAFEDLTIRYFKDLPPAIGVSGTAVFDAQTMSFEATSGRVGDLIAASTAVAITGIGIKGRDTTQLEVETVVEGPIPDALALIEHEPFRFASKLGIDPAAASGTTRTTLRIGTPLNRDMLEEDVRVEASAELRDAGLTSLFGVADLADGAFELEVSRAAMTLAGQALVQTVPLQIIWRETFEGTAPYRRRIELEGVADRSALAAFGIAEPPAGFQGGAPAQVEIVEQGAVRRIRAALDLTPARLAWPELQWRKPVGEPGRLDLDLRQQDGAPLAIERFRLEGGGLSANGHGALGLDPLALETLTIERFRLGEQRGSARIAMARSGVPEIVLNAGSLDLQPFLDEAPGADRDERPEPLELEVVAERVVLDDEGEALRSLTGRLVRDRFGWRDVALEAALPNGAPVRLRLQPTDTGRQLVLTSSDAGELLRTFDRTHRIEGGRFRLEANLFTQVPAVQAEGLLEITGFELLDAPVLARLLTVASLTGIGNLLGGEGIFVDRLRLPFTLARKVLTVDAGRLSGSQLGLTANGEIDFGRGQADLEGTVVPIYSLNRALGQIPVIGDFLAGQEGEGAFAVTYQVSGPLKDPAISVNPLSVLAPGIIRDLFTGLRDGTLSPPTLPPDRD